MIDHLIRWSIRNRLFVLCGAALLLVWGGIESVKAPVDVFPDLTAPTVTVMTEAHGMAPGDVETRVTFPIEASLNGASGVRRIRSSTSVGFSIIWVEFDWGTDIYRARQVVSEKLQLVGGGLPAGVEAPILAPVSSIMGEILFLAITSDQMPPMELRKFVDTTLRRRLLSVAGISQVTPIGGEEKQFQVLLKPDRLGAYKLTTSEVAAALRASSATVTAGFLVEGGQEYLVEGLGRVNRETDLGETVVASRGGAPILLSDIADVVVGAALKRGDASFNGAPAVVVGLQKQPDANTLELTERLDEALDTIEKTLPPGVEIHRNVFRQANFIQIAIRNVSKALLEGIGLVVLVVFLFLVSLRATGITVLAIPLSLVAAVLGVRLFGGTLNTMTLGGLAIAIGALVDDAIIDVENVVRRLREAKLLPEGSRPKPEDTVFEASREVRSSIVFATFVILLVFLPLFFLSGVEGRLLRPLGAAYAVALAASLLVALTVTPALCSLLLPGSKTVLRGTEPWAVVWLKRAYEPALNFALARWKLVAALAGVALLVAGIALALAGRAFLPDFNEGALTLSVVTLPGASLEESNRLGARVEEVLLGQPEVTEVARRQGRAELDEHAMGVNSAEIDVGLTMKRRSKSEFLDAIRKELGAIPGLTVIIGQPISHRIDHMLSGSRANIAIKIFGTDLHELRRVAEEVRAASAPVEGVADLSVEQQADIPTISVQFDRSALARHAMTAEEAAEALEVMSGGHTVAQVFEGQAVVDVVIKYPGKESADFEALRSSLLTIPSGAQVPLHALAEIRRDQSPNMISRENGQRKIVVLCNASSGDLGGVVNRIREQVEETVVLPQGYHIEYGGQFESAEAASRTLFLLGMVVIAGIFLLLFVAFHSVRDALLVMANLPLALIGGVAGVYLSGGAMTIASIIGFITLFGIATRNGIMMILHTHHLVEVEGVTDPEEAVRRGALERLSPIMMTALAAGLALVPLALAGGNPGSEIQAPMAVVILCGLATSTALNMVVVPALYLQFGSIRRRAGIITA